jgi:integrase
MAIALSLTGMRWSGFIEEGNNEWWCESDRVVIKGTKNENSDRFVPLIQPIEKPTRGNLAFRRQIRNIRDDLSPYSFRRSYAQWMELANIPTSRQHVYMGHAPKSQTEYYSRHEVDKFLKEDAETLTNWMLDQLIDDKMDDKIREIWGDSLIEVDEEPRTINVF